MHLFIDKPLVTISLAKMSLKESNSTVTFICVLFITTTLYLQVESSIATNQIKAKINAQNLINNLHKQIRAKENELENAEAVNRNFEKMIQLVNILGQVDTFLTDRTKVFIKKLALLVEDDDDEQRKSFNSFEDD